MIKILSATVLLIISSVFCSAQTGHKTVILKGKVFDNSKAVLLFKAHENSRVSHEEIPVSNDSTFEYRFTNPEDILYTLVLKNEHNTGFFPQDFFADNDTVSFELYPLRYAEKRNIVKGSTKTKYLSEHKNRIQNRLIDAYIPIKTKQDSLFRSNQQDSEEAKALVAKMDSLYAEFLEMNFLELEKDLSIPKYSILIDFVQKARDTPFLSRERLFGVANLYKETFPEHIYTDILISKLEALSTKVNIPFPEIKMTTFTGETDSLSVYVKKNKVVILHLWAPWCGPCIKKGRELVPLYTEYHQKGLEVIGIIGGIKAAEDGLKSFEKYPSPWKTFLEVNYQNHIWDKYGLGHSGGGVFVINKEGQIIGSENSISEIKEILKNELR